MSSSLSTPLSSALTPKKSQVAPVLLLVIGIAASLAAAAYGYIESRRTERVVIAAREVPYGQQINADDLAVIELPLHRPVQVAGITDPNAVVGRYATRQIGMNDLLQPGMLSVDPPNEPVYPNGRKLERNMVPAPFALTGVGPVTDRDRLNIGFIASDPSLCNRAHADVPAGTVLDAPSTLLALEGMRAYACRWMSGIPILYIEEDIAYLEMTPAQAHALRALQAANVALWAERYGATSDPLQYMDRLDAAQVILPDLTRPVTETLRIEPQIVSGVSAPVPGATAPIPGEPTISPSND
ncbi:SAF domain-containing protein [Roseiflexus sp.]|uniref:SAF domain-containing protein n=1 Tax=Roseiflexus sp. TaxID=2562120 RepID=UPI00398BB585